MPECHKCPLNGKADIRCLECKGPPNVNHKGQNLVSIDATTQTQSAAEVAASLKRYEQPGTYRIAPELESARLLAFAFTEISSVEFSLVKRLMRGMSQSQIAREDGKTRAAVNSNLKALIARHPTFGFLRKP